MGGGGGDAASLQQGYDAYQATEAASWEDRVRRAREEAGIERALLGIDHAFAGMEGPNWVLTAPSEALAELPDIEHGAAPLYGGKHPETGEDLSPHAAIQLRMRNAYSPHLKEFQWRLQQARQKRGRLSDVDRSDYYGAVGDAVTARATADLGEQHEDAARRLKYGLARRGLTGSSAAVTNQERLAERKTDAEDRIAGMAEKATLGAKQKDMALRDQLRAAARAGAPVGDVMSRMRVGMGSNLEAALAQADQAAIGTAFAGLGDAFSIAPQAAMYDQQRRRYGSWNPFSWGEGDGYGGSVS